MLAENVGQGLDPCAGTVQAGHDHELLAARLLELLAPGDAELLDRLDAVRSKGRSHHCETLDALASQVLDRLIRVGPDPLDGPAEREAALEANGPVAILEAELLGQQSRRLEALRTVAVPVLAPHAGAAVRSSEADALGGVRLRALRFRHTVEAEKQVVHILAPLANATRYLFRHGFQVVGVVVEGRQHAEEWGAEDLGGCLVRVRQDAARRAGGVVREHGHQQNVVDARRC
mmetsp:Transcript_87063/g.224199  ORF Transcript_87063/g.224199 Transcript_87063/m.224199 type:complete len:232 (+) Transcript_87063:546-1241(+)